MVLLSACLLACPMFLCSDMRVGLQSARESGELSRIRCISSGGSSSYLRLAAAVASLQLDNMTARHDVSVVL